jgi:hypothetical protein
MTEEGKMGEYLEYWMESEPNFSAILSNKDNMVEDVEFYEDGGYPRACVVMDKDLLLLFPPFSENINYERIDYPTDPQNN